VMYSVLYNACTVYLEMVWSCRNLLGRDFQCWFWFGMDVPSCVSDEWFFRKGMANSLFFVLYILYTRYIEGSFVFGLVRTTRGLVECYAQNVEWCRTYEILSSPKQYSHFMFFLYHLTGNATMLLSMLVLALLFFHLHMMYVCICMRECPTKPLPLTCGWKLWKMFGESLNRRFCFSFFSPLPLLQACFFVCSRLPLSRLIPPLESPEHSQGEQLRRWLLCYRCRCHCLCLSPVVLIGPLLCSLVAIISPTDCQSVYMEKPWVIRRT